MYQNYQYSPNNFNYNNPNLQAQKPQINNQQIPMNNQQFSNNQVNPNDDRFVGGFAFPFLLGGVTGAAIAPAFWRPSPYGRPNYYYPPYQPYPYPYYR